MYKINHTNGMGVESYCQNIQGKSFKRLYQNPELRKWLMRANLTCMILLIAFMQVAFAVRAQKISMSQKNASLTEIFREIKKQSGYGFVLPKNLLKQAKPINIEIYNASIDEVLKRCFEGLPFTYTIDDKLIVVSERSAGFTDKVIKYIKDIRVGGKVVDEKGQGLVGANIKLKGSGSNINISTGTGGAFSIQVPGKDAVLIVSYIGYKTQEVIVSGADVELTIRMELFAGQLEEVAVVVSTGYQNIPKERATGSFEIINNELINRTNGSSILARLEGVTTGMLVDRRQNRDSRPNLSDLSIRGLSTLTPTIAIPLIVLDNFPYEGDINNINPNDIESVTVLKDAAAASIWGARAGNGVIVITTKRGKYDQSLQVSFNTNVTITEKPDLLALPQMSTSDYIDVETRLFNEGFYNSKINDVFSWPYLSPVVELLVKTRPGGALTLAQANAQIDAFRNNDVRNDYLKYIYRDAISQQYALNVSGGGRQFNYRLSGGYDRFNANVKTSSDYRATFRSDFSYKPFKNLEINVGTFYMQKRNRTQGRFSGITYNQGILPYSLLADDSGNPLVVGRDYRTVYLDNVADPRNLDWRYRPLAEMNASSNTQKTYDLQLNLGGKYKFSDVFSAQVLYQYGRSLFDTRDWEGQNSYYTRDRINLLTQFTPSTVTRNLPLGSILNVMNGNGNQSNLRGQINADKNWNDKHQFSAIIGAEKRENHSSSNSRNVYAFNDDLLTFQDVNPKLEVRSIKKFESMPSGIDFSDQVYRFTSLFGNAAYTYNNRYTVSGSVRKDAANLFGVNTNLRGAPFWSAGLSWDLSKESFYQSSMIPYLRLRATYGYQGNTDNRLSAFSTIRYSSSPDFSTNLNFADIISPANDDLRWERVGNLNLGVDFRLKGNILNGYIEYYTRRSKDVLVNTPLDYTTGFEFYTYNNTSLKAEGIDLSLHSSNLSTKSNLKWNTDLIFSYNTTEITKFTPIDKSSSGFLTPGLIVGNGFAVGKPITSIYSYEWAGLDPLTGDPRGFINGQISKDYVALIGVTPDKLKFHGSATPVYSGGLRNTFTYKGFSISANITTKLGHYFRRATIQYDALLNSSGITPGGIGHSDFGHRWQKPGDELNTSVPSFVYPSVPSRNQFYQGSSALVEKADHIRLQDIILGYSLYKPNWQFKNIRLFANVSNLGVIWRANKLGLDPELFNTYPLQRSFALGLSTNF